MAVVTVPRENRRLESPAEIREFLSPYGISYEQWETESRVPAETSPEEILAAYAPEIDRLKQAGGYVTADVVDVNPETPGLDAMLNKFNKEHRHSEDEVRFVLSGRGIFHIHGDDDRVFAIELGPGDWINVPCGTRHWFDLCEDRRIRALRLFQDQSGWTPQYVEAGVHQNYTPVCWGPEYVPASQRVRPLAL